MGKTGRPEELFNRYVTLRTATGNIASAPGVLALLWSTVVLLGGFVSVLSVKEFWVLTSLSFLMAFRMAKLGSDEFTKGIYVEEPKIMSILMRYKGIEARRVMIALMFMVSALKLMFAPCFMLLFHVSPFVIVGFAVWRLVQQDYGDAGGDTVNRAKLVAALNIFYALILLQGLFSLYLLVIVWQWMYYGFNSLSAAKFCGLGDEEWGCEVVKMYRLETRRKFIKDGVVPDDWNLIAYGVEFLQSASGDDHLRGVRVLDHLYGKDPSVVIQKLLYSRLSIMNLIGMIGLRGTDNTEKRERAARILAHVASDLSVTQYPGTLQCICSLLDKKDQNGSLEASSQHQHDAVTLMVIEDQTDGDHVQVSSSPDGLAKRKRSSSSRLIEAGIEGFRRGWESSRKAREERRRSSYASRKAREEKKRFTYASRGAKELISQGLLILERLTQDEENCTEITRHQRLISKITSPLRSHDFLSNVMDDDSMVEMLRKSLTVVSRLLTSPGDGATRLHKELASNTEVVSNLMAVLETDSAGARKLNGQALDILTELVLDDSFTKLGSQFQKTKLGSGESTCMLNQLFKTLQRIFLEEKDGNTVVAEPDTEKAIGLRAQAGEALARLLPISAAKDASVAVILSKQDVINLMNKVLTQISSSKMGTTAGAARDSRASNENQSEERKFMAAMLSVVVVMCNKNVISNEDFAHASSEDAALVKKLKEVIESNKNSTAECLRMVKLTCQVVIAMIQAKPNCIQHFNEHKLKEALTEALDSMSEIDDCMLFAGNDREAIMPERSLASLVKEAREKLLETAEDKQGTDSSPPEH